MWLPMFDLPEFNLAAARVQLLEIWQGREL
jgi:hypothetical protein